MSWKEYYQDVNVEPVLSNQKHIKRLVEKITTINPNLELYWAKTPMTFMLAGYHPRATTEFEFRYLQKTLHQHPHDKTVMVDQNHKIRPVNPHTVSIQADLTQHIPSLNDSVDFALMHYTLNFISDSAISKVGLSASHYLSANGLLITVNDYSHFPFLSSLVGSLVNSVPVFVRPTADIVYELSPYLKLIFWGNLKEAEVPVFARTDSPLYSYPTELGAVCLDFDD